MNYYNFNHFLLDYIYDDYSYTSFLHNRSCLVRSKMWCDVKWWDQRIIAEAAVFNWALPIRPYIKFRAEEEREISHCCATRITQRVDTFIHSSVSRQQQGGQQFILYFIWRVNLKLKECVYIIIMLLTGNRQQFSAPFDAASIQLKSVVIPNVMSVDPFSFYYI